MRFLSSMKLALFLLFFLGAVASLGTLIPQGQPPGFYRAYYGETWGNFILLLSLDHLYRSWWFITLGALLGVNLLLCSVRRGKKLTGWKGWGSILLHLSLLLVLAGAALSGYLGRSTYVEIGVGDGVDLAAYGFPGLTLTVKDFRLEYYPNLEPQQYISRLLLETAQGLKREQEVKVNYPLKFKGLKIYQKGYGWLVRGQVSTGTRVFPFELAHGEELLLDEAQNLRLRFFFLPDYDEQGATMHSRSPLPRNPKLACVLLQDTGIIAREVIGEGEGKGVKDYTVTFSGYRYYTGLEIKKDPGLGLVYMGFVLLLLGLVMRYLVPEKIRQVGGET
ncbi:cytochrome c biogenesis protein ResB [Moorellaceae bacterium AZ2]